jgi:hypothetical protein
MTLQELKTWLSDLPEEFLEYQIVHAEVLKLDTDDQEYADDEGEYTIRVDKPITALTVDQNSKEILIMNEFDGNIDDLDLDFDDDPHDGKEFGEKE